MQFEYSNDLKDITIDNKQHIYVVNDEGIRMVSGENSIPYGVGLTKDPVERIDCPGDALAIMTKKHVTIVHRITCSKYDIDVKMESDTETLMDASVDTMGLNVAVVRQIKDDYCKVHLFQWDGEGYIAFHNLSFRNMKGLIRIALSESGDFLYVLDVAGNRILQYTVKQDEVFMSGEDLLPGTVRDVSAMAGRGSYVSLWNGKEHTRKNLD